MGVLCRRASRGESGEARRRSGMPVRSLSSSVLTWPDARTVDQAVRRWAGRQKIVSLSPFGVKVRLGIVWRVDPDGPAVALLKLGVDDFYRLKSLVDTLLAEPV